jgi:hypothetical protein
MLLQHLVNRLFPHIQSGTLINRLLAFTAMGGILAIIAVAKQHKGYGALGFFGTLLLGMFFGAFTGIYLMLWDAIKRYHQQQPLVGGLLALAWLVGLVGMVIGVVAIICAVFIPDT